MMDPTASLLNVRLSIEKFLWDSLAVVLGQLLINKDDLATRLTELEDCGHAIVWQMGTGAGSKFCAQALYVGATYYGDPGCLQLLALVDKVKEQLDATASIPVYNYVDGASVGQPDSPYVPSGGPINQLAIIGDVQYWPTVPEPNGFKTKLLSVNLRYGQVIS